MEPNRFGRKLGIGMRVASKMVKERAAQAAAPAAPSSFVRQPQAAASSTPRPQPAAARPVPPPRPRKNYAEPARRVGQGTRRFGAAFFGPLAHVGSTLWLEITGLFFALFAFFFAQNAYRTRAALHSGAEHTHFVLYCIIGLVFVYFSASSFFKASRRSRKARR